MPRYDKKKILIQAKLAIKENNLFFIEDVVAWLPISKPTLYDYFPVDSNELDTLKEMLEQNKVKTKSSIRAKLFKSNKAAELLALYRLIATPEEHQKLNQQYIDHSSKDGSMTPVNLSALSTEELEKRYELAKKIEDKQDK